MSCPKAFSNRETGSRETQKVTQVSASQEQRQMGEFAGREAGGYGEVSEDMNKR